jgi:hypothetical protein
MMGPGPGGAPYSGQQQQQQQQYPQQQQQGQQYQQQQPILASLYGGGGKGWMADLMTQIRQPLLVAILVFVMSLPVINVMLAFYLPSLLKATGELSTIGLLAKSLLAGALYWTILNVVAPLVST